jgi:hypothetical protein
VVKYIDTGAILGAEKKQGLVRLFVFSNVGKRNAYKISAEQYLGMCSFERMKVR